MNLGTRVRPWRAPLMAAYDVTAWLGATAAATALRYSEPSAAPWKGSALVALALATVYLLVGLAVRLHQGRARTGSLEEMLLVAVVAAFSGMVVFAANAILTVLMWLLSVIKRAVGGD